jgi:hypothetical protein
MSITENCQEESGLSPEVFPASPTPQSDADKAQTTSAIYGLNVAECYAIYNPESRCLKTLQGYLPLPEKSARENILMGFCQTFAKAGMMRSGRLYRLVKSARPTKGKESGLLPTPRASDHFTRKFNKNDLEKKILNTKRSGNNFALCLAELIKWKTGKPMSIYLPEMMMGYPKGWTLIDAPVTPLYLNAPN